MQPMCEQPGCGDPACITLEQQKKDNTWGERHLCEYHAVGLMEKPIARNMRYTHRPMLGEAILHLPGAEEWP